MKKDLLEIILDIDSKEKYFGIVPMYPVFQRAKTKMNNISLDKFHELLLEMEKNNEIYLETVNDITRLSIEEKKTAIYDQVRGYLYYVGRW